MRLEPINFGDVSPIPSAIEMVIDQTTFTTAEESALLRIDGVLGDGSTVDLTDPETGTEYWSSDERLARVSGHP